VVTELPKTISGKIRRVQLRRLGMTMIAATLRATNSLEKFPGLQRCGRPGSSEEWMMNEVWKKPRSRLRPIRTWSAAKSGCRHGICSIRTRIDVCADVIEDHQFIHVDRSAPNATAFGNTVARLPDDVAAEHHVLR
jgi:hypothetical protein